MKDEDHKGRVGSESIVIEETNEACECILKTMADIERNFILGNRRLLFADQKITPRLIDDLGTSAACALRGDRWHLLSEVWLKFLAPKHVDCDLIALDLVPMIDSRAKEKWNNACQSAKNKIRHKPTLVDKLSDARSNPEHHSGHHLKKIPGSMLLMGDTPSEDNHASIDANLGKGATWDVSEHIS